MLRILTNAFANVTNACERLMNEHVEQSSFIPIIDMNRFLQVISERLSDKVVKSRILPKIQVCSENKNKHKM